MGQRGAMMAYDQVMIKSEDVQSATDPYRVLIQPPLVPLGVSSR